MGTFQIPQEDPDWIYYTPKERGGLNLDPELQKIFKTNSENGFAQD